jgi:transposase
MLPTTQTRLLPKSRRTIRDKNPGGSGDAGGGRRCRRACLGNGSSTSYPPRSYPARTVVTRERDRRGGQRAAGIRAVVALVIQHARFRYACRSCQEHVALADKPPQPIDKGSPVPGSRPDDHEQVFRPSPLYRLEDIFARHGVVLSQATSTAGWPRRAAHAALRPDGQARLALDVIHTDDTPCRCSTRRCPDAPAGSGSTSGTPQSLRRVRLRRADGTGGAIPEGVSGYLQADAFSGYERICAGAGVKEVACWAHVRRKFFESRTSAAVLARGVGVFGSSTRSKVPPRVLGRGCRPPAKDSVRC